MPATIDVLGAPKKVLIVASNPAVSEQTGWPIGFWWAELTHPYWEFVEAGYEVTVASPDGGPLQGDGFSDPRDESQYSAHDLISGGFIASPGHSALVADTPALGDLDLDGFDAVFLDPFSPKVEPALWRADFLGEIARRMAPAARLSTYAAGSAVRRALHEAGLQVGRGARVGAKREGNSEGY